MAACFGGLIVFLVILHGIERVYEDVKVLRQLEEPEKDEDQSTKWLREYNRKNSKSKNH